MRWCIRYIIDEDILKSYEKQKIEKIKDSEKHLKNSAFGSILIFKTLLLPPP